MEYYIKCSISWSSVEYIDLYRFGYNIDIIVVSEIQVFILGHTNIIHCEQTEAITLFQANKSDSLYFSNEYHPRLYTFPNELNINPTKFSGLMTYFLLLSTSWKENHPANHRNPKKITIFAFNKRSVTYQRKCPIIQHLVSDSGHSQKS